ncbi:MAG: UDP-N-acetylmuramoyl-L-alanyl-D-glutamate--2,6-diaminopimelate ligase, partial [Candidatus Pelagibacterales bacterium]
MFLGQLLKSVSKNHQKINISGISFDSRKVKKNYIFFAIKGQRTSGTNYINEAILNGASAIVSDKKSKHNSISIPLILVKDVRESLSEACSNFYNQKPKNIVAVTGTNGKSSVVNFFFQILKLNMVSVASIGTLGILSNNFKKKTNLTSIDSLSLHKNLQILAKNKIKNVILEASSHGLKQKRLNNININTGIFTNLSHDHLDYHKNMQSYFSSKLYLFNHLMKKNSKIISDEDIPEFKIIKKIANKRKINKITIGTNSGNIKILNNDYKENKQIIKISINSVVYEFEVSLIGYFQIKNLLMAILAALSCGLNKNKIFSKIHKIKAVPGRLECIANLNNNSNIILDFAHTPDALEQSLIALKKQFNKKIIIVFGCGGERDKKKRYAMGRIASKYCRKIFVTDDNPRNENPKEIRSSIIKGCKKAINIGNRKKAIILAISELKSNEILLVAGKGHEETQNYGYKIISFSDKKIIKEIIYKKKLYFEKKNYQKFLLNKAFNKNKIKNINF